MAKGNMLMGYSRGSVGDVTFARIKGQQIARARNRNPKNPKTNKQSIQRGRFAAAVKFYTRGNQNYYKYAYENKKQVESDYNAFMRENVRRAPAISREAFNNYDYPVFAPFLMAKGSLTPFNNSITDGKVVVDLGVAAPSTLPTTVAELTAVLVENEAFKAGDIITLVTINSDFSGTYPSAAGTGEGKPQWDIKQIILDSTVADTLTDALGVAAVSQGGALVLTDADGTTLLSGTYAAFTCVHTRNTDGGLKASTQELILNTAAATAYEAGYDAAYKAAVIASWQAEGSVDAQPEAILQGSIAYREPQIVTPYAFFEDAYDSEGTRYDMPFNITLGAQESTSQLQYNALQLSQAEGAEVDADLLIFEGGATGLSWETSKVTEADVTQLRSVLTIAANANTDATFVVKYDGVKVGTYKVQFS